MKLNTHLLILLTSPLLSVSHKPGIPTVGTSWFLEHSPPGGSVAKERRISPSSVRLYADGLDRVPAQLPLQSTSRPMDVTPPPLEISPLIVSGPSTNRVDLVFFSDGYLSSEKDKFIDDAMRLAVDISRNQTFNTVQPLLNFWAAFSPSNESGVGVGGNAKDTPFGLYRNGTELRGVYYAKPKVAAAACGSMGVQCDYPILLGNDPLYGGLGGRFTVITSSLANGALILRHELGHSIIPVGEEYDGGFAYFGVNAFANLSEGVPWEHWLSEPLSSAAGKNIRVERSVMPYQSYTWTLLNTSSPWTDTFVSSGTYSRTLFRCSLSGLPSSDDLRIELDGNDLGWTARKDIGVDRWHYDFYLEQALEAGEHEIKFTLLNKDREGKEIENESAQLCSVEIIEFGDEEEFIKDSGYYGVFPTYSEANKTSYRPTNEDCLMRLVTTPNFCKVCIEGLWSALLARVNLIEDVSLSCVPEGDGTSAQVQNLTISLVPLAQFRPVPIDVDESWTITWSKDGNVFDKFANKTSLLLKPDLGGPGEYKVEVQYNTVEIRVDKKGLTKEKAVVVVLTGC